MSLAQHPTANVAVIPRRAYITTAAWNTDFYTYTVTVNPTTFVRTGTLAANVTGATASSCPANRILRETGRRLYPDANPGISTLLVGVYDAVSGLTGLIDPNAPKFAVYNSDKANYMVNGVDPATSLTDQGQPVYTRGTITAGGAIVTSAGQIRSGTTSALATTAPATLDASLAQVFTYTPTQRATINATNVSAGSIVYVVVTTSGTTSYTITFGTNFKATGTLATGTVTAKVFTITFVSDGTNLNEVARTTAM